MRVPRYYNTMFGEKVRNAMKSGELTYRNIHEWDKKENGGKDPTPPFNTKEIMDYFIKENVKMLAKDISDGRYYEMLKERGDRFVFLYFEFEAYGDRCYHYDKVTGRYYSTFRSCGD